MLCFESTPTQDYDGCIGHEHFYIQSYENNVWLGIKGINPSLNGTVISVFCITFDNNCALYSYIDANIFNFIITGNRIYYIGKVYYHDLIFQCLIVVQMLHMKMKGVYVNQVTQEME